MMFFHPEASELCWFHSRKSLYWPETFLIALLSFLLTVFIIWCDLCPQAQPHQTDNFSPYVSQVPRRLTAGARCMWMCEAHLGWQALFPSDRDACLFHRFQAYWLWKQLHIPPAYICNRILNVHSFKQSVSQRFGSVTVTKVKLASHFFL